MTNFLQQREPIAATITGVAGILMDALHVGGAILGFLVSLLTFFWWVRIWWKSFKSGSKDLPEKPNFD
jgi:hypothetical protein